MQGGSNSIEETLDTMWPILISCGLGGSLLGFLYMLFNAAWRKIQALLYSQVIIHYDDD